MEQQARCKKCGHVLKSPQSIAMKMGSTCAGVILKSGKSFHVRIKSSSGRAYQSASIGAQTDSIVGDLSSRPLSKREVVRKIREERRRLFEERQPFNVVFSHMHVRRLFIYLLVMMNGKRIGVVE